MDFDVPYAITRRFGATTLEAVRPRVEEALRAQGFGVLTSIDVAETLRAKLGVSMAPYVILGACNPRLAQRALARAPAVGLLLPCNVVLAQDGADVVVSAVAPREMLGVAPADQAIAEIAAEADERLHRAIDAL